MVRTIKLAAAALGVALGACCATAASAQKIEDASVAAEIRDATGRAIAGGSCALSGTTKQTTTSDATGVCTFSKVQPGPYVLDVRAEGYALQTTTDIVVNAGARTDVPVLLRQPTLQSLSVIGHVTTSSNTTSLNSSPAAESIVPARTFLDQLQPTTRLVLQETPGVQINLVNNQGLSSFQTARPMVRGGFPWETAELVDGHPFPISFTGSTYVQQIDGLFLDGVEVVKGPGSAPPVINGAINGSINLRLRQPTPKLQAMFSELYDGWGGFGTEASASGPLGKKVGFVLAYGVQGSNGYVGTGATTSIVPGANYLVDGHPIAVNPAKPATYPPSVVSANPYGATTLIASGFPLPATWTTRTGLARLRIEPSSSTTVTVTYFRYNAATDGQTSYLAFPVFRPASAYNGSLSSGSTASTSPQAALEKVVYTLSMLEADARTRIGHDDVLARYYAMTATQAIKLAANTGPNFAIPLQLFGSAMLCPPGATVSAGACGPGATAPTLTTFDGQFATVTVPSASQNGVATDLLRGATIEYDHPMGPNLIGITADRAVTTSTYPYIIAAGGTFARGNFVAPGTSITTTSYLARDLLNPTAKLFVSPAVYFNSYRYVTTLDGGRTLNQTNLTHIDPRLGMTFQASRNVIARLGVGSSIAPPFISALNSVAIASPSFVASSPIGPYYGVATGNPNLKPETAFGYDVGADVRLHDPNVTASMDLYSSTLSNQFFQQYTPSGSYNGQNGTYPLYTLAYQNLSKARYEGIELTVRRQPAAGFGFTVQGSLQRAYPYSITPGLYGVPGTSPTRNLSIVPNINYQYALPFFTIGVPYSQGYAEVNYRLPSGFLALFGDTYQGSNNTYRVQAVHFANATLRLPMSPRSYFQVSADNLFNELGGAQYAQYGALNNSAVLITGGQVLRPDTQVGPRSVRTSIAWHL